MIDELNLLDGLQWFILNVKLWLVKYNEWKDRAYKEVIVLDNAEEDDDAGAEVSGDCEGNGDEQEEEQQVVVPLPIAEQVVDVYESGAVSEENKLMM